MTQPISSKKLPLQHTLLDISQSNKCNTLKAIDLFAGIGGIRLGFSQAFGENIELTQLKK